MKLRRRRRKKIWKCGNSFFVPMQMVVIKITLESTTTHLCGVLVYEMCVLGSASYTKVLDLQSNMEQTSQQNTCCLLWLDSNFSLQIFRYRKTWTTIRDTQPTHCILYLHNFWKYCLVEVIFKCRLSSFVWKHHLLHPKSKRQTKWQRKPLKSTVQSTHAHTRTHTHTHTHTHTR